MRRRVRRLRRRVMLAFMGVPTGGGGGGAANNFFFLGFN